MHSKHSKHLSQKLPLHERPENTVEGYGSLVKGQAHEAAGQYSTEHPGVRFGEISLPNSSSLLDETAKMVKFLNTDLPRLCRMEPEHLNETEVKTMTILSDKPLSLSLSLPHTHTHTHTDTHTHIQCESCSLIFFFPDYRPPP